jgi:hypothetical protein
MPKQHRWEHKRKCDFALRHVERAQQIMVQVGSEYEGIHDDYYQAFSNIVLALEQIRNFIIDIRDRV